MTSKEALDAMRGEESRGTGAEGQGGKVTLVDQSEQGPIEAKVVQDDPRVL